MKFSSLCGILQHLKSYHAATTLITLDTFQCLWAGVEGGLPVPFLALFRTNVKISGGQANYILTTTIAAAAILAIY